MLTSGLNSALSAATSGGLGDSLNTSFSKPPSSVIPAEEQQANWDLDLVLKDIQLNSASQGEVRRCSLHLININI